MGLFTPPGLRLIANRWICVHNDVCRTGKVFGLHSLDSLTFDTFVRKGGMSSSNESSFSFIVEGAEARKHSCSTRYHTHQENAHACLRIRGKFLKLF